MKNCSYIVIKFLIFAFCILIFAFSLSFAAQTPEQQVTEVIKDYIIEKYPAWSRDEIKILFKHTAKAFERLKIDGEEVSYKIIEPYSNFKPVGNLILPIEVSAKGDFKKRIFLQARIEVYKDVVVAKEPLKKGKILTEKDLEIIKKDIALLPQKYVTSPSLVLGKEAKMTIPRGSVLFSWMAADSPLVRRGEKVKIIVVGENITIRAEGTALQDGYPDEEIKVKRKGAERILQATVKGPGEVEVRL